MAGKYLSTDKQVQAAGVGRHGLGDGLMLDVKAAKSGGEPGKYWTLRYTAPATGKARWLGLGAYPKVSLAGARRARDEAQELLNQGIDPLEHRAASKAARRTAAAQADARTFDKVAQAFIEAKSAGWSNRKHIAQWTATLATYASPVIGALDVATITTEHIMTILTRQQPDDPNSKGIWYDKPETASRVRGRIESVLAYAIVRWKLKVANPATWRGHMDAVLPSPRKVRKVEHHAALDFRDLGAFMAKLRQAEGIGARALEFGILCASRSSEIRLATWAEIDLHAAVWTIPAERMKAKRAHRVPLSAAAVALLQTLPQGESDGLVFESTLRAGRPLSDATLNAVIDRAPSRRFPMYWAARGAPTAAAEALIKRRAGRVVDIAGADDFFDSLHQRVQAIEALKRPHPLSAELAVAMLKEYLPEERHQIRLHDLLAGEFARALARLDGLNFSVREWDPREFATQASGYIAAIEPLLPLAFTAGMWSNEEQSRPWEDFIAELAARRTGMSGSTVMIELRALPASLAFYAFCFGAAVGRRASLIGRVATKVMDFGYGGKLALGDALNISTVIANGGGDAFKFLPAYAAKNMPGLELIADQLRPASKHALRSPAAFDAALARFELSLSFGFAERRFAADEKVTWVPPGRFQFDQSLRDSLIESWRADLQDGKADLSVMAGLKQPPRFDDVVRCTRDRLQRASRPSCARLREQMELGAVSSLEAAPFFVYATIRASRTTSWKQREDGSSFHYSTSNFGRAPAKLVSG